MAITIEGDSEKAMPQLKVAIIGGGPAGFAAAIEMSKRSYIDWKLYEKKDEISEIGNGLTIQRNTWRMLEKMGAAGHLRASDFFRPPGGHLTQHRNGRTGLLLSSTSPQAGVLPHQEPCRAHRAKLQQALLKQVDKSRISVGKRLISFQPQCSGKVRITFSDGATDEVDLLIGADGIRSVVREYAFPGYNVQYTGATAYRTVVKKSDALDINGLPPAVIFWHGTDGKWVYTCPLGGDDFEVTCRIKEPGYENRSSWGKEASVEHFRDSFSEFCPPIRQLLELSTWVQQFDYFAGPRLDTVVEGGSIALIGDASHPLSGAFGAGAGFALEDAHVLGGSIEWAVAEGKTVSDALKLFDKVRSAHYSALYAVLDQFRDVEKELASTMQTPNEEIESRVRGLWHSKYNWMYYHEADESLADAIKQSTRRESPAGGNPIIQSPGAEERPRKHMRAVKL